MELRKDLLFGDKWIKLHTSPMLQAFKYDEHIVKGKGFSFDLDWLNKLQAYAALNVYQTQQEKLTSKFYDRYEDHERILNDRLKPCEWTLPVRCKKPVACPETGCFEGQAQHPMTWDTLPEDEAEETRYWLTPYKPSSPDLFCHETALEDQATLPYSPDHLPSAQPPIFTFGEELFKEPDDEGVVVSMDEEGEDVILTVIKHEEMLKRKKLKRCEHLSFDFMSKLCEAEGHSIKTHEERLKKCQDRLNLRKRDYLRAVKECVEHERKWEEKRERKRLAQAAWMACIEEEKAMRMNEETEAITISDSEEDEEDRRCILIESR